MSRPSDIWWRQSKNCYYTTIDGNQVRLCKTLKQSQTRLQRILRGEEPVSRRGSARQPRPCSTASRAGMTFAELAEKFLDHSQAVNEPDTYKTHLFFLQSFKDQVGNHKSVSDLCEHDLDLWCQKHANGGATVKAGGKKGGERKGKPWSENAQARARAIVLATLNFGVKKLNMPDHALKHVRPGSVTNRERYLTVEERSTIRGAVSGVFADLVFALEQTGARPFSEVSKVTAADVDLQKGTWTLVKWKNAKKQKGKKRVIFLSEPMLDLTRRLMQQNPTGTLFRNSTGTPWSKCSITWRFRQLAEKLKLEGLTAYVFRHSAITDALVKGIPAAVVAELFGTSIQSIARSYSHIDQKHDVLREAMLRAIN